MPLTYHDFRGAYFVRVAKYVIPPALVNRSAFTVRDPISTILSGSYFDLGWVPCEALRRVYWSRGTPGDVILTGEKPKFTRYDGSLDYRRYGSFLDSVAAVGSVFRGGDIFHFEPGAEHNVLHTNLSGDVGPSLIGPLKQECTGDVESMFVTNGGDYFFYLINVPVFHENAGLIFNRIHGVNGLLGWEYYSDPPEAYSWAPRREVRAACNYIRDVLLPSDALHLTGRFDWGVYHELFVTDFSIEDTDDHYIVRYHLEWTEDIYGSPKYTGWDTVISFDKIPRFGAPLGYEDGRSDAPQYVENTIRVTRTFTDCASNIADWFGSYTPGSVVSAVDTTDYVWFLSDPSPSEGKSHGGVVRLDDFASSRPWLTFRDEIESVASDIRFSSFLSTSDSLSQITASLDTDIYQTLLKLPAIADQIPEVELIVKGIYQLSRGKVSGLKDLLDFLTSVRLQHQFEWRSEYDLLANLVPQMSGVLSVIDKLISNSGDDAIAYGEFHYRFPDGTFGRPTSQLTTHSRVVAARDSYRVLDRLLRVRSLGFNPGFSTAWDLIPFSFVANWFTGVGPRIRDLENMALIATMDLKCFTHSYRITSPFTPEELDRFGLKPSNTPGSKTPELVFFAREVSSHIPRMGVGRFDFRLPGGLPSWATVGSLAWQVIAGAVIP